jgi:hypothetical protein
VDKGAQIFSGHPADQDDKQRQQQILDERNAMSSGFGMLALRLNRYRPARWAYSESVPTGQTQLQNPRRNVNASAG